MTSLRDSDLNAALRGTSAYTDPNGAPATEGTGEAGHPRPVVTDAERVRNDDEARARTRDTRERAFENAYTQKLEEAPGFGAHETPDAKGLKAAMASVGLPPAQPGVVAQVNAKVANNPEFKQLVADMAGVLQAGPQGAQAIPSPDAWAKRLNIVAASAGLGALGSTAAAGQGGGQRASVGAGEGAGAAGTPAPSAEGQTPVQYDADGKVVDPAAPAPAQAAGAEGNAPGAAGAGGKASGLPLTGNTTALVFLVMLNAQRETQKVKGDTLRHVQMYNGMLQELNNLVGSTLIPAQKQLSEMTSKSKDSKKNEQMRVRVDFPTSIDTDTASMDADSGKVVLNAQYGDATHSGAVLADSTVLQGMIDQANQWRQSIQNNQQQQSNRFQAQDSQMSSTWNMITSVLKTHSDAVNAVVRNIPG